MIDERTDRPASAKADGRAVAAEALRLLHTVGSFAAGAGPVRLCDGFLLVLLLPSVAVLFASAAWLADMVSFFRPHLAVASVLGLALCLLVRSGSRAVLAALLCALNFWPLVVQSRPVSSYAGGPTVRVMSANLQFVNLDEERFEAAVARLKPDIIVAQEATPFWRAVLAGLPGLPYRAAMPSSLTGVEIVSRYPLEASLVEGAALRTGRFGGSNAIRASVTIGTGEGTDAPRTLTLYAIHAPTPRTPDGWRLRNAYLAAVAARAGAEPDSAAVAVVGDWNTPFWSPFYGRFLEAARLEAAERSPWPAPTRVFQEFGAPVWLGTPIDHIAVSSDIGVAAFGHGPRTGSDHLPVFADIELSSR